MGCSTVPHFPPIGKKAPAIVPNIVRNSVIYSGFVIIGDGVMVMPDKLCGRPGILLAAIGGVLLTLWIAVGYDAEGPSDLSPLRHTAQVR
jgi:hypothetical protein